MIAIELGKYDEAANDFRLTSNFPEACRRLCLQEALCEGSCTVAGYDRAVNIGKLEAFCADALLREGRRLKIDVGKMQHGQSSRWFLDDATLGLLSDIYPFADSIQHGDLTQIGCLLSTVVSSTPSHLRIILEGSKKIDMSADMVLIANMSYIGPRFQIFPYVFWNDNHLDVFVFSDMSKLDLISYAVQSTSGAVEDVRIKHYRVKRPMICMQLLWDGFTT